MKERIDATVRLIIGPRGHGTMRLRTTSLGEVDFGPEAMLGYPAHHQLRERWFDRWLKGADNGVEAYAPIEIFVMGGGSGRKTTGGLLDHGGRWRDGCEWPITRTEHRTLYLTAAGALTDRAPNDGAVLTYQHDPENHVATAGGSIAHLAEIAEPDGGWDEIPPFGDRAAYYGGQGKQIVPWGPGRPAPARLVWRRLRRRT